MNSNQNIETPTSFFEAVEHLFNVQFKYDLAASAENTKCENFFTEQNNSLSFAWPLDGWCWLNPPFRKLSKFIPKCVTERKKGVRIISIWPLSGDLNQIPTWTNSDVYIIHGRVWPEVRGLMLCVWNKKSIGKVSGLRWNKKELSKLW